MLSREKFIKFSLELNLFYLRIMKEHLFFIETSLSPSETNNRRMAELLKMSVEELMLEVLPLADEYISQGVIDSNELITEYTSQVEEITMKLTGSDINFEITEKELELSSKKDCDYSEWLESYLLNFNCRAINIIEEVFIFKKEILQKFIDCKLFINLYPEMLEHIIHETKFYLEILKSLIKRQIPDKKFCDELNFWNYIMKEHASFIDGLLDPSEEDLKKISEKFVLHYDKLISNCTKTQKDKILDKSLELTEYIKEYKLTAVQGIVECEIRSIIQPLLADHVLREANHYLRLLKKFY
ncbi:MAG: DUF2935 domain-containing protein [Tissierella sp.]|uniref:DUF2935 domain-containing protein n=1 Tax=Tissierella sp. TaxID=41274 RepID=UPI003F943FD6